MENGDRCRSTHLIDGDGSFNVAGIKNFAKEIKLAECGLSYAVVAIMGPQSSGKSTLLNHMFGTNFGEMNASEGRSRTTEGIWLAHAVSTEPSTLVMDLKGIDGQEKGEDDIALEKQIALFALAVSDIVLINTWCHDIGREQANRPLLEIVFQAMMKLFTPRKTTLMFVIRDKTRTPFQKLERVLMEEIQKIWNSAPKPQAHKETPLSEFFNVEVVALSSYEDKEEEFKEQVASLRHRFFGCIAGDRRGVVPASGFSFSAHQIWKDIKENKDLDLPAHEVMVATVRCEEIVNEKISSFNLNEEWCQLEESVQSQQVPGFGLKLTSMLDVSLSEYDEEAMYFDKDIRSSKRKQLEEKLLQLVQPAYHSMLGHICSGTLERFKEAFHNTLNEGTRFATAVRDCTEQFLLYFDVASADAFIGQANWDSSKVREKLRCDIDAHITAVRHTKFSQFTTMYEKNLNGALAGPVKVLLDAGHDNTWPEIRELLRRETETAVNWFLVALDGFEIEDETRGIMCSRLVNYARAMVESKAKEEAKRVLILMKDRFSTLLNHDTGSRARVWTGKEDVQAIIKTVRYASLKLLSVMAAIRLDDNADSIENTLSHALVEPGSNNSLDSSSWDKVPPSKTLLTPAQCKSLWVQFIAETDCNVQQAIAAHENAARENAARENAAREKAAREKAARENAAREEAARENAAREKAARENAAREEAARENAACAARENAAREAAEREKNKGGFFCAIQ